MNRENTKTSSPTVIKIARPKGCDKTTLNVNALDKHTRDMAWASFVYVERVDDESGDPALSPVLVDSLKLNERGNLVLEVRPECFEFVAEEEYT